VDAKVDDTADAGRSGWAQIHHELLEFDGKRIGFAE
jgi:hypothetical protein